jgi:hypothetical protein
VAYLACADDIFEIFEETVFMLVGRLGFHLGDALYFSLRPLINAFSR